MTLLLPTGEIEILTPEDELHLGRVAARDRVLGFRRIDRLGVAARPVPTLGALWTVTRADGVVAAVSARSRRDLEDLQDDRDHVLSQASRLRVEEVAEGQYRSWWLVLDRRVVLVAPRSWAPRAWEVSGRREADRTIDLLARLAEPSR